MSTFELTPEEMELFLTESAEQVDTMEELLVTLEKGTDPDAVAAARRGAKVVLVETAGHIGLHIPIGLGVVIGIPGWKPTIHEGLFKELAERVAATGQHNELPMTRDQLFERIKRRFGFEGGPTV